jgi:hypothetical protein
VLCKAEHRAPLRGILQPSTGDNVIELITKFWREREIPGLRELTPFASRRDRWRG